MHFGGQIFLMISVKKIMGGYGSGRYGTFGKKPKDTVESAKCLDIRQLFPKPTLGQQVAQIDNGQVIKLVWTNCNYGGQRPWFICPKCQSRVGKLYDRNHSLRGLSLLLNLYTKEAKTKFFRCRKCLNLAYESTRKTKSQRLRSKQYKLKEKLEANLIQLVTNGLVIPKPKSMHLSTYLKILNQIELLEMEIMTQQMLEFDKIMYNLAKLMLDTK